MVTTILTGGGGAVCTIGAEKAVPTAKSHFICMSFTRGFFKKKKKTEYFLGLFPSTYMCAHIKFLPTRSLSLSPSPTLYILVPSIQINSTNGAAGRVLCISIKRFVIFYKPTCNSAGGRGEGEIALPGKNGEGGKATFLPITSPPPKLEYHNP